ncbi:family 43 glycosylhydrolase [Mobilitalea sibirica]|uniref:Family 43 glycosylhydrolase n=1 Tax=Mobilitalea sibirica TaxID=1462919 RepID=A0A8J7GYZ2_9FIRM|nr:glycoside hydrolase family 43 protein [Mobilitalea sibirica]MBH1940929.1 family 43 glycosylhydrolase [Mobilitalea sibirica]
MAKNYLKCAMLILCMVVLAGCQKETGKNEENNPSTDINSSTNTISNTDNELSQKETLPTEAAEQWNSMAEEAGKSRTKEQQLTSFEFEPTIENPSLMFENITLSESYKSKYFHNPIMTHKFGADPFALVYNGRVYVYMTGDIIEKSDGKILKNSYSQIKSLNLISSDDLVNWTDHGEVVIGGYHGVSMWANNSWAPAATYKNINGKDKFFLYFANSANGIGVLTSDSPTGPFKDPLQKSLVSRQTPLSSSAEIPWLFDPAVLVDDDGKAYLYYGGGVPTGKEEMPNSARVVELGEDMISLIGTPKVVEAPFFFEAAYINKIGDIYYYTYCSNWSSRENAVGEHIPEPANIIYMTSKSPMGPWEYQGSILENPGKFFGSYGNNHHSIIQFNDKWYIFYHSQLLQDAMGITGGYRSPHVDEAIITQEGVIEPVKASKAGVPQIKSFDPYQLNEAETFAWSAGVSTVKIDEISENYGEVNQAVSDISTGDWFGLSNVDFGNTAPHAFTAKVSSELAGNVIQISLDSPEGEIIGYLEIPNTESEDKFVEVAIEVSEVTGVQDLYFTFNGEGFLFDTWRFIK